MQNVKNDTLQQYNKDGYVMFHNVLDADLIQEAREHVEWLQQRHPDVRPENLDQKYVQGDPFWIRLVSDDRLLDIAEQFVGPNVALFASHYISKPPYIGKPVLWHQDGSYWPLKPMEVITLWLAVDDSVPENGCMRVIPGTHAMDLQKLYPNKENEENVLGRSMDKSLVDESKAVDLVVRAGGVTIHHPNIIHGSEANRSPMRRCGLTIRYIPASTQITAKPWPCAYLLRGSAIEGVNDYQPRPVYQEGVHMPFRGCEEWK